MTAASFKRASISRFTSPPHIDVPWILQVAEAAGVNDPAPDDYGVPVSAVTRHRAELFEQPVYDGPYAKAAALGSHAGPLPLAGALPPGRRRRHRR